MVDWKYVYLGNIDMVRARGGPDDLFCDIFGHDYATMSAWSYLRYNDFTHGAVARRTLCPQKICLLGSG